ncbi:related to nitrate reductase [Rhynchosporium agropyri]|uniref:Related to nitrate reductase n=1 Tax=Rhynchosporium agropyri TaxID=914238 RepID=A0A1E1LDV9_9HELO|nr:related to nitrate reductase [Rhynchosporium agropyri]
MSENMAPIASESVNRPDEWKIEQGINGAKLPFLDQTGPETVKIHPVIWGDLTRDDAAIEAVGNRDELFKKELDGWKGYVEWEKYPEKKAMAHKILTSQTFPPNPQYQMGPIPDTNPVLPGDDYKAWHAAIGGELTTASDDSWRMVLEEKHPDMLHLLQFPYNGEPPKRLVTSKPITPNSLHFVRNHGGIPIIDKEKWTLDLNGLVANPRSYTLDDLMDESKFPRMEKLVTMQCSGTCRIEQITLYAGQGDEVPQAPWAEGAIGTANYVGISLKKMIKDCGGLVNGGKHLEFYGAETYFKADQAMNYVVSVPWSKVKANEVILTREMNGEPLPKIHGYPLRVVVLGYIGARSVKWLYRIKVIENPTLAPVQSKKYLYFNQQIGKTISDRQMGFKFKKCRSARQSCLHGTSKSSYTMVLSIAKAGLTLAADAGQTVSSFQLMEDSPGMLSQTTKCPRSISGPGEHGNLIYHATLKAGSR